MPTLSTGGVPTQYPAVTLVNRDGSAYNPAADIPTGTYISSRAPTAAIAQTIDRSVRVVESVAVLSNARMSLFAIRLKGDQLITSITFISGTTALAGATNQWFALYDVNRNKLAVTSDDTSTAWAASSLKTLALSSPYTVPSDGYYYLGINVVATTIPTLMGVAASTIVAGLPPILAGFSTSGLSNPASAPATAAALTTHSSLVYAYVS